MVWVLAAQVLASAPSTGNGVALGLFADRPDYDYQPLVAEIAATGATELLVAVPWSVPHIGSHALVSDVPRGVLATVLRDAASADLDVCVMPIVTVSSRPDGEWRGLVAPQDRGIFWSNYEGLLRDVAVDAERGGATRLVVGSELNSLENDPAWSDVIGATREVFSGSLLYSANWDRYSRVPFWSHLDEVGVTAYFPVHGPTTWPDELSRLHTFAHLQGKPLVITEYGYPALASASERPWDEMTGTVYDARQQALLVDGALRSLHADPPSAHFLWNWFGTGEPDEASFTPRNRPANNVLRTHFQSTVPARERP